MTTETPGAGLLDQSLKRIEPVVQGMTDIEALRGLGQAERQGQKRTGVLNLIQNRVGALMIEGSTMPASPELAALGDDYETTRENLLGGANAELAQGDHAINSGTIEHRRPRKVTIFVKQDWGGWIPRTIPKPNVAQALQDGARPFCPDCGRDDCCVRQPQGDFSGDLNACTGRAARPFKRCGVCGKRFYDVLVARDLGESDDPLEIKRDLFADLSPEQRIDANLNLHLRSFHATEAAALGLPPNTDRLPRTVIGMA